MENLSVSLDSDGRVIGRADRIRHQRVSSLLELLRLVNLAELAQKLGVLHETVEQRRSPALFQSFSFVSSYSFSRWANFAPILFAVFIYEPYEEARHSQEVSGERPRA